MTIIEKYQDMAGKWRVVYEITSGEIMNLKFQTDPSDAQILTKANEYMASTTYILRSVFRIPLLIEKNKGIIETAVAYIKNHPTLTLAQWNALLATQQWYESSIVRWFLFALATELATKADISLVDLTESEVLGKLRNWIVATSAEKLRRIIWGE